LDPRRSFTRLLLVALLGVAHGLSVSAQTPGGPVEARLQADLTVVKAFRPAYPFWQHIFTIRDGRIAFGSAQDGRLVVTFPVKGDWLKDGLWVDPAMSATLGGRPFPVRLDDRRDEVVRRLEPTIGPLLHNPTRGLFLLPNVPKYGPFLSEWSLIYERSASPPTSAWRRRSSNPASTARPARAPTPLASVSSSAATGRC